MRQYGELTGRETAIQLWNIFARFGQNLLCIHFTAILKQFGGVDINGTVEKHGTAAFIFSSFCTLSGSSVIADLWNL